MILLPLERISNSAHNQTNLNSLCSYSVSLSEVTTVLNPLEASSTALATASLQPISPGKQTISHISRIGAVILANAHWKKAVAYRKQTKYFSVNDFPKVKLWWGNFHGYIQKNKLTKIITHYSFRGKFNKLIRTLRS